MLLTAAPGLLYVISYFNGFRDGRGLKRHHLRDMPAMLELLVPLGEQGFRYEDRFANGPPDHEEFKRNRQIVWDGLGLIEDLVPFRQVDESFLRKGKMIAQVTRPPMDDLRRKDRIYSQPGFTSIEQKIFRVCRRYFQYCARSLVQLSDRLAAGLSLEHADRAAIEFHQTLDATIQEFKALDGSRKRKLTRDDLKTMAYLLHLKNVAELNGADLLLAFGLSGTQTLAFAYRLRHDLSDLLEKTGLTIVEMTMPETPGVPEPDCGGQWAMEWSIDHVLHLEPLPEDAARERPEKPRAAKTHSGRTPAATA